MPQIIVVVKLYNIGYGEPFAGVPVHTTWASRC